ncbi:MAG: hypothetical protein IJV35_03125 [Neisseriaceae bacterium]|nr:hypothetical protein [Neisseriaceae bacterium]
MSSEQLFRQSCGLTDIFLITLRYCFRLPETDKKLAILPDKAKLNNCSLFTAHFFRLPERDFYC